MLLAHREDDWVSSDPRRIHRWFVGAVDLHGERLRRVCRYLKAWRDHHSPELAPLSSIILMACACRAFDEVGRPNMPERDDLAMLKVVERLPDYMRGEIENPSDRAEKLCSRLSDEARRDAVAKAESLKAEMGAIIGKCVSESQAIEGMRELLGARIPNDVSLVSVAESATVEVLRNPPRHVPAPTVGRSQSG